MTPMLTDDTGGTAFYERVYYSPLSPLRIVQVPFFDLPVNVFPPTPNASTIASKGDTSGPGETTPRGQQPIF